MGAVNGGLKGTSESHADGGDSTMAAAVPSSEAGDRIGEIIDRVLGGERVPITRYGTTKAYVVGAKEYERFIEFEKDDAKRSKR